MDLKLSIKSKSQFEEILFELLNPLQIKEEKSFRESKKKV